MIKYLQFKYANVYFATVFSGFSLFLLLRQIFGCRVRNNGSGIVDGVSFSRYAVFVCGVWTVWANKHVKSNGVHEPVENHHSIIKCNSLIPVFSFAQFVLFSLSHLRTHSCTASPVGSAMPWESDRENQSELCTKIFITRY